MLCSVAVSSPECPYVLSVLIPAFNEERTVEVVIEAVKAVDLPMEIILVDDGSTDATWERMRHFADGDSVRAFQHSVNQGKGAAVRTALGHARGRLILIQDADLEQDPREYPSMVEPLLDGTATVVYGTRRFAGHQGYHSLWFTFGNWIVTLATNLFYGCKITDMENGFKVMPLDVALSLDLQARGFELEPEITAKVLRLGHRIHEVPVSYHARTRAEGKKITAMDGLRAVATLAKFRHWSPRPLGSVPATRSVTTETSVPRSKVTSDDP
jgi:glycosyltransferase involved in cell wall biosynthesis